MKIKGRVTVLFNHDGMIIEFEDEAASIIFAKATLTAEQTCKALSRLSSVPCEMKLRELDRLGKTHEHKSFEFELPKNSAGDREEVAKKIVQEVCPKGWVPDLYFGSQTSFFYREDQLWARAIIRRWV